MYTREELSALFDKYMASLPLPQSPAGLYDPIRYTLGQGGKRIRPMVLLTTCDCYGGDMQVALPTAAAIEIYHNFTLMHDDIMDNSEVRRGKPTVHRQWDSNTAILSGDAMLIFAYHMLAMGKPELLGDLAGEFNKMALEVCEGQQIDIDFEDREDVTLEEYIDMIRLKTAVIFGAAAKMGAMVAGAPQEDCKALYDMGIELGLAFQIQDDYLDTYGTPEILGKAIGDDIAEAKKTFLAINALNEAGAATRRALLATFADRKLPLSHKMGRVKTIYDSLDIPEITRNIIAEHLARAAQLLDGLSMQEGNKAPYMELIKTLENRNK